MFWPAVTSSWPAWPVEIPEQRRGAWGGGRDQRRELRVELGDLVVEERDARGEAAQRELGGLTGSLRLAGVGAQAPAEGGLALQRLARGELLAQLAGRGEDQIAELQHRGGARLHRALAGDAQLADRLDDPGRLLRDHRRRVRRAT